MANLSNPERGPIHNKKVDNLTCESCTGYSPEQDYIIDVQAQTHTQNHKGSSQNGQNLNIHVFTSLPTPIASAPRSGPATPTSTCSMYRAGRGSEEGSGGWRNSRVVAALVEKSSDGSRRGACVSHAGGRCHWSTFSG